MEGDIVTQLRIRCEGYQGQPRTHYCGKCAPCYGARVIELQFDAINKWEEEKDCEIEMMTTADHNLQDRIDEANRSYY